MNKKNKHKSKRFLFEEVLKVLAKSDTIAVNYKQIASKLSITNHSEKLLIVNILSELKTQGSVTDNGKGKFKLISNSKNVVGRVDMTGSGTAYIITEELDEDVMVSSHKTFSALHGDTVKVKVYPSKGRPEGEIIEVLERAKTSFVGVIQISAKFAFLIPSSTKMNTDIFVPLNRLKGAKNGQKVIAEIVEWPTNGSKPIGQIIDVLGDAGNNDTEMHAILAEFDLPYEFAPEVEKFAESVATEITEADISKRRDMRGITTFTIDPVDAKDFDDALSIQKLPNGNWEIGIHIADVSHYVTPGSILDKEALSRATSVYLVDRVVPMLPEVLSNKVCSLRPNEEKLCFSAIFELDENADVAKEWFGRTIINSDRRFTYEEAQFILETEEGEYSEELLTLDRLAKLLRAERFRTGSIGFERMELKFDIDKDGKPIGVFFKEAKDSNRLIEDFMLLANRKVAEFVGKVKGKSDQKKTFVYRIHDKPNPDKIATLSEFVKKFGYKMNTETGGALAKSFNKLLKSVHDTKEQGMIELLAIRTMAKAIYTVDNIGHYGLGFSHYTHFTSPIRRYPDVMVHRLLQHYLDGGKSVNASKLEEQCLHSSDMEKRAADAERSSNKYKQVEYLMDKIGEEFEGTISGVTDWGMFVEIKENHCEGMIRVRDIPGDYFTFDADNYCLKGRKSGKKYSLGDEVRVEIKRADLSKKQLDFELIE